MSLVTIKSPLDMHLHLRDSDMLSLVGKLSSSTFAGALVMPNLIPPVSSKEEVKAYKDRINLSLI